MKEEAKKSFDELNNELMQCLRAHDTKALELIKKVRALGVKHKDNEIIGYGLYRMAYYYYFVKHDLKLFRKYVKEAVKVLLRCEDKEFLGGTYNLVAYDALDIGSYDVAYAYYMIAVQACEKKEGIALPGLIEASAGRLLLELGDYRKSRIQQRNAAKRLHSFKDMHVYHYNMILTYSDIALASFFLHDTKEISKMIDLIEDHYNKANQEEKNLCFAYYMMPLIYKALLTKDDDLLEQSLASLIDYWTNLAQDELFGVIFEIESMCEYMLAHDYIAQAAQLIEATSSLEEEKNTSVVLRYFTLKVSYYEKIHDLDNLYKCLKAQHEYQKKKRGEITDSVRYATEFSDMIGAIAREREKAKEENIELMKKANTDSLTGLPNRNAMNNYIQHKFDEAEANKTMFGIGIIDVDYFKSYNDTYGHQAGDVCLKHVGDALLSFSTDPRIFCARYGGDEFVVGYFGLTDKEINKVKRDIQKQVDIHTAKTEREPIRISQGVCNGVPDGEKKLWDYLSVADKKLYSIKKRKRR